MLPSLDSLRCFVAVARLLSFRRAATSVHLTPQALSQRIRQLEDLVGAPLFARTTRTVRLTEQGTRLLPVAERTLAAAQDCLAVVAADGAFAPTELVVGTRHELGLSWIEPSLGTLRKKLPWLGLGLYFGSGTDLVARLRSLELDCAVTSSRLADPRLEGIRLHREDYAFVAAPSLLKRSRLTRDEEARDHVLLDIDGTAPLFQYWREAADGRDLRFARLTPFGTIEAIRRRVLAGDGVAVLPLYLVRADLGAKRLVRVLPKVTPRHDWFRLVFRTDDPRRPQYEALAQALSAIPLR